MLHQLHNDGLQWTTSLDAYLFTPIDQQLHEEALLRYHTHWREWHRVIKPNQRWLESWLLRIPRGCDCAADFTRWVDANPPQFDNWFPYSVAGHNYVSAKLSRPAISVDEAHSIWFPDWKFLTLKDLADATIALASKLPPIRGVAGVPVSGMLVAPQLSTLLHVPLYEASYEFGIRRCAHGYRGSSRHVDESLPLLVVDDTISSGRSLGDVRHRLQDETNLIYAVALANPPAADQVDLYGQLCPEPHLLEWNLANTGYIRSLGFPNYKSGAGIMLDFDGVLCLDPPHFDETTDTGREAYLRWIESAPLGSFVPRMFTIPDIVSYRCEYTRPATEAWLERHGIKYDRLHLWGDPNSSPATQASSRTWQAKDWKGRIYNDSACGLFIESSMSQTVEINLVARKPVLCWDSRKLFN
jgi:hypothetical protein